MITRNDREDVRYHGNCGAPERVVNNDYLERIILLQQVHQNKNEVDENVDNNEDGLDDPGTIHLILIIPAISAFFKIALLSVGTL